jgi:DNA invertase Pin-like site-specific DNA recombinase
MDLTSAIWRKATRSGGNGGNCVEVASNLPGVVAIRDSKRPGGGAHVIERPAFAEFLDDVKAGKLDL